MTLLELVSNKRTQGLKDQEVTYIDNSLSLPSDDTK